VSRRVSKAPPDPWEYLGVSIDPALYLSIHYYFLFLLMFL
jgi:hypothetical protein